MRGIENRIEFDVSPRIVFKHLADPQNIPLYAPGIRAATVTDWVPEGPGTRMTLTTRNRHHRQAYVTEEAARKFIAIQDDHGTVNEWELKRAPDGTTRAVNRIIGEFPDGRYETLASEAKSKLYAFKDLVDSGAHAARNGLNGNGAR